MIFFTTSAPSFDKNNFHITHTVSRSAIIFQAEKAPLTLHFTRHKGMFVKLIKYRYECVQGRIKQCRKMHVFPKLLAIYTFPDYGDVGPVIYQI